jgi:hypothetical protein
MNALCVCVSAPSAIEILRNRSSARAALVVREETIDKRRRLEAHIEDPVPAVLAVGLRNVKELDIGRVALDVLPEQLRVILRVQETCRP